MKKLNFGVITLLFVLFFSSNLLAQSKVEKGKLLIDKYACSACHNDYGLKAAPAFAGIAMRYTKSDSDNAAKKISTAIAEGGKGKYPKFENSVMPPYPQISENDRFEMAAYILSLKKKNSKNMKNCNHF